MGLFGAHECAVSEVAAHLDKHHYLGAARRGVAWRDEYGVVVVSRPTSRGIPKEWLEVSRWCLRGQKNDGSRQWRRVAAYLRENYPEASTVVSYSDPSAGHTGALYRACGWLWAPTWHRLRPPPTGNGSWDGRTAEAVKDRWVFLLRRDDNRERALSVKDDAVVSRYPWASYREPKWRGNRWMQSLDNWKRWMEGKS